jgi:hypothetical protein
MTEAGADENGVPFARVSAPRLARVSAGLNDRTLSRLSALSGNLPPRIVRDYLAMKVGRPHPTPHRRNTPACMSHTGQIFVPCSFRTGHRDRQLHQPSLGVHPAGLGIHVLQVGRDPHVHSHLPQPRAARPDPWRYHRGKRSKLAEEL